MHGCVDQRTTQDKHLLNCLSSSWAPILYAARLAQHPKRSLRSTGQEARRALKATSEPLLRSDCGQTAIRARKTDEPQEQNPANCGVLFGALGRTRTCGFPNL